MDLQMCFDCLQRQLRTDFFDELLFNYALAASALPFGSATQEDYESESVEKGEEAVYSIVLKKLSSS
ncbi:hypothetical protein L2E82_15689 [Cichorium intybus]|uniref:Uncharacterized protein n=1 Tax=Cichorium intybus TaxID=13427 RepID=A0ACB9F4E5_CICIN|nr:hypothetical protein L2E82_15689 [Cichorium intybus]